MLVFIVFWFGFAVNVLSSTVIHIERVPDMVAHQELLFRRGIFLFPHASVVAFKKLHDSS